MTPASPIPQTRLTNAAQWCAVALGFTIPISTALDSVLLSAFLVLWFLEKGLSQRLRLVREHPVAVAGLAFAALTLLGATWSSAAPEQLREALVDGSRFLFLGLFAVAFLDPSTRDRAQFAFLLSSTAVLVLSFAVWAGVGDGLPGVKGRPDYPVVFKSHSTHNALLATAALLFTLHAIEARGRRARVLLGALAVAAAIDVFFLVPGRPGQLALAAAIAYLALARFHWRRGSLAAAAVLVPLVVVAWVTSGSVLHPGSEAHRHEPQAAEIDEPQSLHSSVEQRLEYYGNAVEIIGEHPVIGVGSGGFRAAYEAKVRGTQMHLIDHPHSAFLHVGVELGLIGLAVLVVFLQIQWRSAGGLADFSERTAARGFLVIFVVAGLVSSTWDDHTQGLFYAWASGLFFATVHRRAKEAS